MSGDDRTVFTETFDLPAKPEPAGLAGRRSVRAVARIRHDGKVHMPGTDTEVLAVDAETYAQLAMIGAIEVTPWEALEIASAGVVLSPAEPVPPVDPRPGPAGAVE